MQRLDDAGEAAAETAERDRTSAASQSARKVVAVASTSLAASPWRSAPRARAAAAAVQRNRHRVADERGGGGADLDVASSSRPMTWPPTSMRSAVQGRSRRRRTRSPSLPRGGRRGKAGTRARGAAARASGTCPPARRTGRAAITAGGVLRADGRAGARADRGRDLLAGAAADLVAEEAADGCAAEHAAAAPAIWRLVWGCGAAGAGRRRRQGEALTRFIVFCRVNRLEFRRTADRRGLSRANGRRANGYSWPIRIDGTDGAAAPSPAAPRPRSKAGRRGRQAWQRYRRDDRARACRLRRAEIAAAVRSSARQIARCR